MKSSEACEKYPVFRKIYLSSVNLLVQNCANVVLEVLQILGLGPKEVGADGLMTGVLVGYRGGVYIVYCVHHVDVEDFFLSWCSMFT